MFVEIVIIASPMRESSDLVKQNTRKTVLTEKYHYMNEELQALQDKIVVMLKSVFDPEIPVNIYDLGMIYDVDVDDDNNVTIEMTFTSPNCPAADFILMDVQLKVESIKEVNKVDINLTFDPPWDRSMMSEEALLELGMM